MSRSLKINFEEASRTATGQSHVQTCLFLFASFTRHEIQIDSTDGVGIAKSSNQMKVLHRFKHWRQRLMNYRSWTLIVDQTGTQWRTRVWIPLQLQKLFSLFIKLNIFLSSFSCFLFWETAGVWSTEVSFHWMSQFDDIAGPFPHLRILTFDQIDLQQSDTCPISVPTFHRIDVLVLLVTWKKIF